MSGSTTCELLQIITVRVSVSKIMLTFDDPIEPYLIDSWDLSMSTVVDDDCKLTVSNRSLPSNRTEFFGLSNHVRNLILKYKGIEKLYDWQLECLNLPAIKDRRNLVYSLPTSGGKTLVAEILILRELLINKKNVIFALPYVALAQEKVRSLAPFGLDLNFYVEEYVGGKGKYPPVKHLKKNSIYVCTTEKAAGLIDNLWSANRLTEIGMLVVDEIHLMGESSRGPILEMMLSKLLFIAKNVHIVGMSATVGNLHEIGQFLNAEIYTQNFRPVDLIEYVKCNDKVYKIIRNNAGCEFFFDRTLKYQYSENLRRLDPGLLGGLVCEIIPDESCLVFCSTRKQCSHFAMLICEAVSRSVKEIRKNEKMSLLRALGEEGQGNICPILKKTIPYGVVYHHSGLTNAERKLLEEAFIAGTICCICCTSTLAAGINLPAKRVVIFSPYVGKDFLKLSTYMQMCGRAGRKGLTNVGESYVVCQDNDMPKILELLKSAMDKCESRMSLDSFVKLTTQAIGLGIADTAENLKNFYKVTLHQIQNSGNENSKTADEIVKESVQQLISVNAIKESQSGKYTLTAIANAAMIANLDVNEAQIVYQDLMEAIDNGLILKNYLHLFYLVTPYSAAEEVPIDRQVVISIFSDLSAAEKKIAERLGISEVCLIQYSKHGKVTMIPEIIWNRFLRSLIIFNLWNKNSIWEVSEKFCVPRGTIHTFLVRTAAFASSVQRFTEALKMEEFEYFPTLLQNIIPRISHCCSPELLQLMQLPAVKIGRANQLFKAGYKTLQNIVNADPVKLVKSIDHLPRRVAYEIVAAAKLLLLEKAETLQEEAENIKAELNEKNELDILFSNIEYFAESQPGSPRIKQQRL